jgi:hypothetical protein
MQKLSGNIRQFFYPPAHLIETLLTAENAEHAESLWFVVHRKIQPKFTYINSGSFDKLRMTRSFLRLRARLRQGYAEVCAFATKILELWLFNLRVKWGGAIRGLLGRTK